MGVILHYIKTLFDIGIVSMFIFVGLFLLLRDVQLLKKKKLYRESIIAKMLGYLYILGSIMLFIIRKMM